MFCLECGTEMAVRARACPVCGHIYSDRELSLVELRPTDPTRSSSAGEAPGISGRTPSKAPSVKYVGDLGVSGPTGLPRDLPGRFVLGVSLGMAADLLLPWVNINNTYVTPASIGAPVVVVVALLAAAVLPVFTTSLRQHHVWSALPLMVGAFCAGIAGAVWLVLVPLAQIVAVSFGSDSSILVLSPEAGLYLFLLGSAVLLVSGQRMLAAMHKAELVEARLDAIHSLQARTAASAAARPPVAASAQLSAMPTTVAPQGEVNTPAVASTEPVTTPATDGTQQGPIAPATFRSGPGSAWGRSRGPHRLR